MTLERMRHAGRQLKLALSLPCCLASLLLVALLLAPAKSFAACTTTNPNPNPNPASFAAVVDFNGDCKSDLLWRNTSTEQVFFWLMNGTTFTSSGSLGTVSQDWNIAGVGDFNGDGKADILWQNSTTGQIFIWFMNGTTYSSTGTPGSASPPQSTTCCSGVGNGWSIQGVGDYDGSGRAGILWRQLTSGQVYIWLMNGATIGRTGTPATPAAGWELAP